MMRKRSPFFGWLTLTAILNSLSGGSYAGEGLPYVNSLRAKVGLRALEPHTQLQKAAKRHANYLNINRPPGKVNRAISAHAESAYLLGYSGNDPAERAVAAGYAHQVVRENVSVGYPDARAAVDGLMGAIYHRLVFLDPTLTEAGEGAQEFTHVFVLGRSDLTGVCADPPAAALASAAVDCLGTRINRQYYDNLCADLPSEAVYVAPFPKSCPQGQRLDRAFMNALCKRLPKQAILEGNGRYYPLCGDQRRIKAAWFESFCSALPARAAYAGSGAYYKLCDGKTKVQAEWLKQHCANIPPAGLYTDSGRFRKVCIRPHQIRVEYLEELDNKRWAMAPELVVWPAEGMSGISPAFFEEDPDPLPDYGVSGYPLSIQVDPVLYNKVELESFDLYRAEGDKDDWIKVMPTRLLDARRDPQKVLNEYTFALFPMRRLEWNSEYVAVAKLVLDGQPRRIEWGFRTRALDVPVLELAGDKAVFEIVPGVEYALYVVPRRSESKTVTRIKTERHPLSEIEVKVIDPNTVKLKASPASCDRIKLTFDGGRKAELRPADSCTGGY